MKYVPKFYIGHVISRMRNDDMHWTVTLEPNISKTLGDGGLMMANITFLSFLLFSMRQSRHGAVVEYFRPS